MNSKKQLFSYIDVVLFVLLYIISLFIFSSDLMPTVSFEESGQLITSAYFLGIPIPPGFPLWNLLGKLSIMLMPGNIAFRVSMLSAVISALSISFLFFLLSYFIMLFLDYREPGKLNISENDTYFGVKLKRIFLPRIIGLIGVFIFMFSNTFWSQAVTAGTYPLGMLLFILLMLCSVKLYYLYRNQVASNSERLACILAGSFLAGLGLSLHHHFIIALPVYLFILIITGSFKHASKKIIAGMLLLFLLGLTPLLYLPIRAVSGAEPNLGAPSISRLGEYLFTKNINPDPAGKSIVMIRYQMLYYAKLMVMEFYYIPLIFAAVGLVALSLKKYNRPLMAVTLYLFLFNGLFVILYASPKIQDLFRYNVFVMASNLMVPIWSSIGLVLIINLIIKARKWKKQVIFLIALLVIAFYSVSPVYSYLKNNVFNSRDCYFEFYNYACNSLLNLDRDALLFSSSGNYSNPLAYLNRIEKKRCDVTVIQAPLLSFKWYSDRLEKNNAGRKELVFPVLTKPDYPYFDIVNSLIRLNYDKYPVYFDSVIASNIVKYFNRELPFYPEGNLYRLILKEQTDEQLYINKINYIVNNPFYDPWTGYRYFFSDSRNINDEYSSGLYDKYLESRKNQANWFVKFGRNDKAINALLAAKEIPSRKMFDVYDTLGKLFVKGDNLRQAAATVEEYIKYYGNDSYFTYMLSIVYEKMGAYDQAIKYLKYTIQTDQRKFDAYASIARLYEDQGKFEDAIFYLEQASAVFYTSSGTTREEKLIKDWIDRLMVELADSAAQDTAVKKADAGNNPKAD